MVQLIGKNNHPPGKKFLHQSKLIQPLKMTQLVKIIQVVI